MKYKLIIDNGKPYEVVVNSDDELRTELNKLKAQSEQENHYIDVWVFNDQEEEITDSQFIQEMI